jgi:RNA polymerase sigma-70 factor (ECF subfamily)
MTETIDTDARAEPRQDTAQRVFREQFPYVFHTLRRLGVPRRDLEDLTHEVFVTFFRRLDAYDDALPIRPWLFGIAFRIVSNDKNRLRMTHEQLGDDGDPEPIDGAPLADDQLELHRRRKLVLDALDTLADDRKAVLIMHDLDGAVMPDVAAVLSIPLNTAYSRLRLAREDFKSAVSRLRARGELR